MRPRVGRAGVREGVNGRGADAAGVDRGRAGVRGGRRAAPADPPHLSDEGGGSGQQQPGGAEEAGERLDLDVAAGPRFVWAAGVVDGHISLPSKGLANIN